MRRLETPNRSFMIICAALSLGAALLGCSDPPPPQTGGDVRPANTAPVAQPGADTANESSGSIHIDDKIVKACGDLPTAHFAFDSANIEAAASDALDALARCFISGPLKGKGMKLIGHADPRGETEYNLALGQRRAGSVAGFLAKRGLEQNRMATSSKGEFEATGVDEGGWARDRKVEVLLAD
jgi:peptidoglycan-associated lipoprotein